MYKLIPAISEQILNVLFRNKETLKSHSLNWWTNNPPFTMSGGLLSAYYLYMRTGEDFKNFRSSINFPKDSIFMIDSGGFELESQQLNPDKAHINTIKALTPSKVLEIQESNAQPNDVGIILDRPPYKKVIRNDKSVDWIHDPAFFKSSMEFTSSNTQYALSNRTSPNLKLYGVLQGEEYEHMIEWYNEMKSYNVDGWCVVPTPKSNHMKTAMFISLLLENQITKPIHFLGISGFNSLALIIYLLRKDQNNIPYYPSLLTSDSSSYNSGAKNRSYTLPSNHRSNIVIGNIEEKLDSDNMGNVFISKKRNSLTIPLSHLPCLCPVCENTSVEEMRSSTNTGSIAASLHNLYQQKLMITILTSLISHPPTYIDYVSKHNDPNTSIELKSMFSLFDNIISFKRNYTSTPTSWKNPEYSNSIEDILL